MNDQEKYDELLDELYDLTEKEYEGIKLTDDENNRYLFIVNTLKKNNIPIEFGIEI